MHHYARINQKISFRDLIEISITVQARLQMWTQSDF